MRVVRLHAGLLLVILLTATVAAPSQDFTYTTNSGTVTITRYTGTNSEVTIPTTITGLPVTSIGYAAFLYQGLTSVTIPSSVTNIDRLAFQCINLSSVLLPQGVRYVAPRAFDGCSSLTNIAVEALNGTYSSLDGVLCNRNGTTLVMYPPGRVGNYIVPKGVTRIADYAFFGCGLTGIIFPNSVTNIGEASFRSSSLSWLILPGSVSSIGSGAFEGTSITNLVIEKGLTAIADNAFAFCNQLTNVSLPDSLTSIGAWGFAYCGILESIVIPASVTSIGDDAFFGGGNHRVFFKGNWPAIGLAAFGDLAYVGLIAYYLPGTSGWDSPFFHGDGFYAVSARVWQLPYPVILQASSNLSIQTNLFSFTVSWATNLDVVVEASSEPVSSFWQPIQTNALVGGTWYFSDPQWTNYPSRFYRVRSP